MNQDQSFISNILTSLIGAILAVIVMEWWMKRRERKQRDIDV